MVGKYLGSKPGVTGKPASLTMWGLWEPKEVMDSVIADYKKMHPNVDIMYEERSFVSLKSYKESIFTRLSEGSAPDIIRVHNSWVPSLQGNLSPAPSSIFSATDYENMFYPVAKESAVSEGKVYAVPLHYDGLALLYNKQMFNEGGISSPPATWEEFRIVASRLAKKDKAGNLEVAGAAIGSANNIDHFSSILGLLFSQGGIKVPDDLNSQAAADALTFYTNFVTVEKVWSDVLPPSVEAFADNKVAMVFAPSWEVLNILNRNPNINMGIAPVPRALDLEGNPIVIDWGSFWMEAVSKNSSSPDAAWEFLKYLSTEEVQRKLYSEQSKARPFGEPYSLKSLQGDLSGNAYLDVYVKTAETAKSGVLSSKSGNDKEVDLLKTAVNTVLSGEPASEALSTAQKSFGK